MAINRFKTDMIEDRTSGQKLSSLLADIAHQNVAYVETNGNDTSGQINKIGKPFATINAALDVLPSTGGVVKIGLGRFAPVDKAKVKDNVSLIGARMPSVKSDYTGLQDNGTVINGSLQFINHHNVKVYDLGVDSGSSVCASLYSNANNIEGLTISPFNIGGPYFDTPLLTGIEVKNVIAITKNPTVAVHSILIEGVVGANIDNLETYYGLHGIALKLTGSNASNLKAHGSQNNGVIIRDSPDFFAPCRNSNFKNIYIDTIAGVGGGLNLNANTPDTLLQGINIDNVVVTGTTSYGIKMESSASSYVNANNLSNLFLRGCAYNGIEFIGRCLNNNFSNVIVDNSYANGIKLSSASEMNEFHNTKITTNPNTNNGKGFSFNGKDNKIIGGFVSGFNLGGVDVAGTGTNFMYNTSVKNNAGGDVIGGSLNWLETDMIISSSAYATTAQSLTSGSTTPLALDTERWDTFNMHDATTYPSRIVCKVPGKYRVTGSAEYATSATGYRYLMITVNGQTPTGLPPVTAQPLSAVGTAMNIQAELNLQLNDYVEIRALQNAGTLNVSNANLTLTRIGL